MCRGLDCMRTFKGSKSAFALKGLLGLRWCISQMEVKKKFCGNVHREVRPDIQSYRRSHTPDYRQI